MKRTRVSHTKFIRNKKGKVTKVIRTGDDVSLDAKIKEFQRKRRSQAKKESKKKWEKRKKQVNGVLKGLNKLSKNIDNANDWFLGKK